MHQSSLSLCKIQVRALMCIQTPSCTPLLLQLTDQQRLPCLLACWQQVICSTLLCAAGSVRNLRTAPSCAFSKFQHVKADTSLRCPGLQAQTMCTATAEHC